MHTQLIKMTKYLCLYLHCQFLSVNVVITSGYSASPRKTCTFLFFCTQNELIPPCRRALKSTSRFAGVGLWPLTVFLPLVTHLMSHAAFQVFRYQSSIPYPRPFSLKEQKSLFKMLFETSRYNKDSTLCGLCSLIDLDDALREGDFICCLRVFLPWQMCILSLKKIHHQVPLPCTAPYSCFNDGPVDWNDSSGVSPMRSLRILQMNSLSHIYWRSTALVRWCTF